MKHGSDITLFCANSYRRSGEELHGVVGNDITLTYTISKLAFQIFTLKYNRSVVDIAPNLMVTSRVEDKRFVFKDLIVGTNHQVIQLTLTNLTLHDNNMMFHYEYKDSRLQFESGFNMLQVHKPLPPQATRSNIFPLTFTNLIIICVVVIVVLLTATTLLLLCRRTVARVVPCCTPRDQRRYRVTHRHQGMRDPMGEPIYATPESTLSPRPPEQMEYAQLGPGGGRLDKPPIVPPKKSVYAQVKRSDVDYPGFDSIQFRTPGVDDGTSNKEGCDYVDPVNIIPLIPSS